MQYNHAIIQVTLSVFSCATVYIPFVYSLRGICKQKKLSSLLQLRKQAEHMSHYVLPEAMPFRHKHFYRLEESMITEDHRVKKLIVHQFY